MANPTAEWEKVGDKFYRKIQLYTAVFDQDLELENYIVTGCSYGGAIGTLLFCQNLNRKESFWDALSTGKCWASEGSERAGSPLPTPNGHVLKLRFSSRFFRLLPEPII
jgi:hypothetical protein